MDEIPTGNDEVRLICHFNTHHNDSNEFSEHEQLR